MHEITRYVREITSADRAALEHLLGVRLREGQQLFIRVRDEEPIEIDTNGGGTKPDTGTPALPAWCDVYAGLSDDEVDGIEKLIVRDPATRKFG